jgi:AhpD family alkylhydroperoxidase
MLMTGVPFPDHTLESAPPGSREIMAAMVRKRGHVPAAVARLASSPQLLDAFVKASGLFESASLDPVAREVVILTIATRNRCHVCVAMHTARLAALGAGADLIAALRDQRPLPDERLAAVQNFTLDVVAAAGAVSQDSMAAFLGHGYTAQNALEVVLGVGAYTMSTLANRLTGAPLDEQLRAFAWPEPAAVA